jgi:hypothetical protein
MSPPPPLMTPPRCRRATAMPWCSLAAAAANPALMPSCHQNCHCHRRHQAVHRAAAVTAVDFIFIIIVVSVVVDIPLFVAAPDFS